MQVAARAWRAPNHPQTCALTCTVIDDLAAKLEMDPYELFLKNLALSNGSSLPGAIAPQVYAAEMLIAGQLMDWKTKWKGRGKWDDGGWKRGLGMSLHTWGGRAGNGTCTVKVHPDGTVETFAGTQDLGTGTRTAIAMVAAETFGIPLSSVKVNIGSNAYPASGPSGGSTTIGGVTGPHRRAALSALGQIFDKVADRYQVDAATLQAKDQKILSGEKAICTWKEAAGLTGPMGLETQGKGPANDGLTSQGVGGVQMVDLSVDPETGRVRINKYVAVQDMGLVINPHLAKSQILGAMIQCISYGLSEERIMDPATGRFINANLRDYKLPRIGDIGELVVEIYEPEDQYQRGVIGLGEPPVIGGGAADLQRCGQCLGVRVSRLASDSQTNSRHTGRHETGGLTMKQFEYAQPQTEADAVRLLAESQGPSAVLAAGMDLVMLLKQSLVQARAGRRYHADRLAARNSDHRARASTIGESHHAGGNCGKPPAQGLSRTSRCRVRRAGHSSPADGHARGGLVPPAQLLVLPFGIRAVWNRPRAARCRRLATTAITPSSGIRVRPSMSVLRGLPRRLSPASARAQNRRTAIRCSAEWIPLERVLHHPQARTARSDGAQARAVLDARSASSRRAQA